MPHNVLIYINDVKISYSARSFYLYFQACAKTCEFIYSQLLFIQDSLDGKNLESVLTEFGIRVHRQIYEHLQQFQYTSIGKIWDQFRFLGNAHLPLP